MRQVFAGALSLIESHKLAPVLIPSQVAVVNPRRGSKGRVVLTFSTPPVDDAGRLMREVHGLGTFLVSGGCASEFRVFNVGLKTLLENQREQPYDVDSGKRCVFMTLSRELKDSELASLKSRLARNPLVKHAGYYLDVPIKTTASTLRALHEPTSGPGLSSSYRAFVQNIWRACGIVDPSGVQIDGEHIRKARQSAKKTGDRNLGEIVNDPKKVLVTFYALRQTNK